MLRRLLAARLRHHHLENNRLRRQMAVHPRRQGLSHQQLVRLVLRPLRAIGMPMQPIGALFLTAPVCLSY